MITINGGAFQDAVGTPLSGGRLVLQLSTDAQQTVTNPDGQVISGLPISLTLDAEGNIPSTELWSNEELAPVGTYYTVRLFSVSGQHVWAKPQTWVFSQSTGQSVDIGTIVPGSSSSPSYPGAVVRIPDADQTVSGGFKIINGGGFDGPVTGDITSAGASSFVSMSTRQFNGFIFMADRYAGSTAAQKINAAMAAAIAAGGGTVDARGLGGDQTIDEQINVGQAGTGIVLLLPASAEWSITINDPTKSGIKQFGTSSIIGSGTLINRMIISGSASASVDSFYRTDEIAGGSYIRAEGFQLYDRLGSTIATAIGVFQNLYDNCTFANIHIGCHVGTGKTGMLVYGGGFSTSFRNITVDMEEHGRCVFLKADASNFNRQMAFYDLSATHPQSGYSAVEISGGSGTFYNNNGILFTNFHVEFGNAGGAIGMKVVDATAVHVVGATIGNAGAGTGYTGFDLSETVAGTLRDFHVQGYQWQMGASNDALNNHITGETNALPTRYFPSYSYGGSTGANPVAVPSVVVDNKVQYKDASGNLLVELPNNSGTRLSLNTGLHLGGITGTAYSNIDTSADGAQGALLNLNPIPEVNTAASSARFFRDTNTSGARRVIVYKGDGTSTETASIDAATGKATLNGGLVVNNIAAPTVGANQLGLGSTTATTVGAPGGASALPATPTGYLIVNIAGTNFKIPYYAN
jgi:hypothetical protein